MSDFHDYRVRQHLANIHLIPGLCNNTTSPDQVYVREVLTDPVHTTILKNLKALGFIGCQLAKNLSILGIFTGHTHPSGILH